MGKDKTTPINVKVDSKLHSNIKIYAIKNEMDIKDLYPQIIKLGYEQLIKK